MSSCTFHPLHVADSKANHHFPCKSRSVSPLTNSISSTNLRIHPGSSWWDKVLESSSNYGKSRKPSTSACNAPIGSSHTPSSLRINMSSLKRKPRHKNTTRLHLYKMPLWLSLRSQTYMYWGGIPLLLSYAVYSLYFQEHKSWYSYIITTLVGFVYAWGFLMMVSSSSLANLTLRFLHCTSIIDFVLLPTCPAVRWYTNVFADSFCMLTCSFEHNRGWSF